MSQSDGGPRGWTPASTAPRLTIEEVERRLMATARELVDKYGLTISFDHLPMDELVRAAGVSRSSVYRRWPSREDFFAEFLASLVPSNSSGGPMFNEGTALRAEDVVRDAAPELLETDEGRQSVFATAVLRGVRQNFEALAADHNWTTHAALVATVSASQNEQIRETVRDALRRADRRYIDEMAGLFDRLLPALHLRWKPGYTGRLLATAGAAVVEGLVQRSALNPDLVDIEVPRSSTTAEADRWRLAEVGFLAITQAMTETLTPTQPTTIDRSDNSAPIVQPLDKAQVARAN